MIKDIRRTKPKSIVALGATASILLGVEGAVSRNRGKAYEFENMPVWVTYHPSYVRRFGKRQPRLHQLVVEDLKRYWEQASADAADRVTAASPEARVSTAGR